MRHPTFAEGGQTTDWKTVRLLVFGLDDPFRFLVRQTFRKLGVREVTAYGVAAETANVLGRGIDLALVDLGFAPEDGLTVIEHLRGLPGGDLPVLAVVPGGQADLVARARRLGIEGVVPKPVSGHELTLRVAETLATPRRLPPTDRPPERPVHAVPPPVAAAAKSPPPAAAAAKSPPLVAPARPAVAPAVPSPPPPRRRPTGGTLGDDDLVPLAQKQGSGGTLGDDDLAPPVDDAARRRREARRRQAWLDEMAESGHVPRTGGDVGRLDVSAVVAEHGKWLDSKGTEGRRASFAGQDLAGADLTEAMLPQASFREADLSDVCLARARLDGSDFRRAVLSAADLAGADLGVAALRHARLDLSNLEGAILRGTDLSGAVLSRARLAGADLKGAVLVGADLREADLSKVEGLTQAQIDRTLCNLDTRLPPGLSRPPGQQEY